MNVASNDLSPGSFVLGVQNGIGLRLCHHHGVITSAATDVIEEGTVVRGPVTLLVQPTRHIFQMIHVRCLLQHHKTTILQGLSALEFVVVDNQPLRAICSSRAVGHPLTPILSAPCQSVSSHDAHKVRCPCVLRVLLLL